MENQILDIKVFVEVDFVYMSTEDWLKVEKVLSKISYGRSVSKDKEGNPEFMISEKVH
jgi:hypothetical protein